MKNKSKEKSVRIACPLCNSEIVNSSNRTDSGTQCVCTYGHCYTITLSPTTSNYGSGLVLKTTFTGYTEQNKKRLVVFLQYIGLSGSEWEEEDALVPISEMTAHKFLYFSMRMSSSDFHEFEYILSLFVKLFTGKDAALPWEALPKFMAEKVFAFMLLVRRRRVKFDATPYIEKYRYDPLMESTLNGEITQKQIGYIRHLSNRSPIHKQIYNEIMEVYRFLWGNTRVEQLTKADAAFLIINLQFDDTLGDTTPV